MKAKSKPAAAKRGGMNRHEAALRDFAMSYPEAHEDFPWGERAIKVKGKAFLFMRGGDSGLSLSTKLPVSNAAALTLPFAEPTHYGLGKSGWVTATFAPKETPPLDVLREWVDESYRAVAPKKLVASLSDRKSPPAKGTKSAKR